MATETTWDSETTLWDTGLGLPDPGRTVWDPVPTVVARVEHVERAPAIATAERTPGAAIVLTPNPRRPRG